MYQNLDILSSSPLIPYLHTQWSQTYKEEDADNVESNLADSHHILRYPKSHAAVVDNGCNRL